MKPASPARSRGYGDGILVRFLFKYLLETLATILLAAINKLKLNNLQQLERNI